MRKKILFLICMMLLAGCSSIDSSSSQNVVQHPFSGGEIQMSNTSTRGSSSSYSIDNIHAADVLALFQAQNLPIGSFEEYNQASDPNGLLGQSNSYIEKISFTDTRLQLEPEDTQPLGGTIEIFKSEEDAKARYTYLRNMSTSSVLKMYVFQHKTVLLRLEKRLSEKQAQEYEQILNNLENGMYE